MNTQLHAFFSKELENLFNKLDTNIYFELETDDITVSKIQERVINEDPKEVRDILIELFNNQYSERLSSYGYNFLDIFEQLPEEQLNALVSSTKFVPFIIMVASTSELS